MRLNGYTHPKHVFYLHYIYIYMYKYNLLLMAIHRLYWGPLIIMNKFLLSIQYKQIHIYMGVYYVVLYIYHILTVYKYLLPLTYIIYNYNSIYYYMNLSMNIMYIYNIIWFGLVIRL